ncbi:hypothetical protein FRC01_002880 [Tulasnella sp. 417]|nr:hypothetical protein FRC01_002880 [Tulasnella sp. 417]
MSTANSNSEADVSISHKPEMPTIDQELGTTDLLIRAISMILFLLWPEAEPSHPRSNSYYHRLDRLSLLFVSGGGADVAAISAEIHKDGVVVEAVQECNEPIEGRLEVRKNHNKSEVSRTATEYDPAILRIALLEDPIRFCIERGVSAISPHAHGEVLEKILTSMYQAQSPPIQECKELELLNRYIYCFCIGKIRKRLTSRILGYSNSYVCLFLDRKGLGLITREQLKSRDVSRQRRPSGAKIPDESWLFDALTTTYPGVDFGVAPKNPGSYQMDVNEERAWYIWDFFTTTLKALDDLSDRLESLVKGRNTSKAKSSEKQKAAASEDDHPDESTPTTTSPDLYKPVHAALDAIAEKMELLYCFAHESGSFWQLVTSMSELLASRQGYRYALSPTSPTPQPGPSSPVIGSPSGISPIYQGFNFDIPELKQPAPASQFDGSALSNTGDPEEPHVDVNEQSREDDENSDSDDGDDSVDNPYRLSDVALRARSWLRRLTQWYAALNDLSQGHLAVGILNKKLTIKVEIAPQPIEPTKQASLRATVEAVVGQDRVDESLDLILSRARQKWPDPDRLPSWPAGKTLVTGSKSDESSLKSWDDQFFSSSVHCEACLACEMPKNVVKKGAIGVSKRCCFCCTVLLRALGVKQKIPSSHGKVYPYAPPSQASQLVKQKLLDALKEKLESALDKYAAEHRTGDSSPGSDHGSAVPKRGRRKYKNVDTADLVSQLNQSFGM